MRSIVLGWVGAAALFLSQGAGASIACRGEAEPSASTTVTALGGGTYRYAISISGDGFPNCGTTQQVTDFYIPYFSDMGIDFSSADFSGTFSSYGVEADSIFGLGGQVLRYRFAATQFNSIVSQQVYFDAAFAGAEGPFESALVDKYGFHSTFKGDPLIPGSPEFLAALDGANRVAEPGALALTLAGMGAMLGLRRRGAARAPAWAAA